MHFSALSFAIFNQGNKCDCIKLTIKAGEILFKYKFVIRNPSGIFENIPCYQFLNFRNDISWNSYFWDEWPQFFEMIPPIPMIRACEQRRKDRTWRPIVFKNCGRDRDSHLIPYLLPFLIPHKFNCTKLNAVKGLPIEWFCTGSTRGRHFVAN